jgi:hypothetical protein
MPPASVTKVEIFFGRISPDTIRYFPTYSAKAGIKKGYLRFQPVKSRADILVAMGLETSVQPLICGRRRPGGSISGTFIGNDQIPLRPGPSKTYSNGQLDWFMTIASVIGLPAYRRLRRDCLPSALSWHYSRRETGVRRRTVT